jgi:MurNAc alpha-1-phosphate uridylyltransferase
MVMAAGWASACAAHRDPAKPLVEVAGRPLIEHALVRLEAAGVRKAVVNVHYLADMLERHLAKRGGALDVAISDERAMLLETGGGLVHALPHIDADPFLVVNSDNLWVDGPIDSLRLLASHWDDERMDALLLLVPLARAYCHQGRGDFHMDASGKLRRRKAQAVAPFVFTGIQMISKRLLEGDHPAGTVLHQPVLERGDRGGAPLRHGSPGPLVRRRAA